MLLLLSSKIEPKKNKKKNAWEKIKKTFYSLCHTFGQDIYTVCFEVFAFQLEIRLKKTRIYSFVRESGQSGYK